MDFLDSFWDALLFLFAAFIFIAALFAVITVVFDLIRDASLKGWQKGVWLVALVLLPLLSTLIYFIARGAGMAERANKQQQELQRETDNYIRTVAGTSPAEQIATAKELRESGAISEEEFESLKRHALAETGR